MLKPALCSDSDVLNICLDLGIKTLQIPVFFFTTNMAGNSSGGCSKNLLLEQQRCLQSVPTVAKMTCFILWLKWSCRRQHLHLLARTLACEHVICCDTYSRNDERVVCRDAWLLCMGTLPAEVFQKRLYE